MPVLYMPVQTGSLSLNPSFLTFRWFQTNEDLHRRRSRAPHLFFLMNRITTVDDEVSWGDDDKTSSLALLFTLERDDWMSCRFIDSGSCELEHRHTTKFSQLHPIPGDDVTWNYLFHSLLHVLHNTLLGLRYSTTRGRWAKSLKPQKSSFLW